MKRINNEDSFVSREAILSDSFCDISEYLGVKRLFVSQREKQVLLLQKTLLKKAVWALVAILSIIGVTVIVANGNHTVIAAILLAVLPLTMLPTAIAYRKGRKGISSFHFDPHLYKINSPESSKVLELDPTDSNLDVDSLSNISFAKSIVAESILGGTENSKAYRESVGYSADYLQDLINGSRRQIVKSEKEALLGESVNLRQPAPYNYMELPGVQERMEEERKKEEHEKKPHNSRQRSRISRRMRERDFTMGSDDYEEIHRLYKSNINLINSIMLDDDYKVKIRNYDGNENLLDSLANEAASVLKKYRNQTYSYDKSLERMDIIRLEAEAYQFHLDIE